MGKKKFVCFCEDVTEAEVREAIAEGFRDIESVKRFTSTFMGPCQGKLCGMATIKLVAQETGKAVEDVGVPTQRPPVKPVRMGLLAEGYEPAKAD